MNNDADTDLPAIDLRAEHLAPAARPVPFGWLSTAAIAMLIAALSVFAAIHETQSADAAARHRSAAQQNLARAQSDLASINAGVAAARAKLTQQQTRARVIRAAAARALRAGTAAEAAVNTLSRIINDAASARLRNDTAGYNAVVQAQHDQEQATATAVLDFTRAAAALELLAGDTSTIV